MHLRVLALGLSLTLLTWVPPLGAGTSPASAADPLEGTLRATLVPPRTTYKADFPNPGSLDFTWTGKVSCGFFVGATPTPDQARWDHADEDNCPHDTFSHPGTITVVVEELLLGRAVTCTYEGSLSGEGSCEVPVPVLSINPIEASEGDGFMTVVLSLSVATDKDVTGKVSTSPVSACEAEEPAANELDERNDYLKLSMGFAIPAGQTEIDVQVALLNDLMHERDELFDVIVTEVTNALVVRRTGVTGIINDDDDKPSIKLGKSSVEEGKKALLRLSLVSGDQPIPTGAGASVAFETRMRTAKGKDFLGKSGRVEWQPPGCGERGETTRLIKVQTLQDSQKEGDEFFNISLSNPVNAVLEKSFVRVTIKDDD